MRWLRNIVSLGLLVALGAIVLVTGLSEHSDDYGQVPLPQGGPVHLPEGEVTIFLRHLTDQLDPSQKASMHLGFQVVPAVGGAPVSISSENDAPAVDSVTRSETIGELGAVGKLDVPAAGDYRVVASGDMQPGVAFLDFGTNAGAALVARWKLLAALLAAAILVSLVPIPRRRRGEESGAPVGWSNDPRAPYAG
jgi:hypothetical protein